MKILLVEDDREAAKYLVTGLNQHGHSVEVAFNGLEGLERARSEQFDVLVVDRMLPKLDGLELLQRLRDHHNFVPALILSALGDVDHRVQGLQAGGDDYLVKPYALPELVARLEALNRRNEKFSPLRALSESGLILDRESQELSNPDNRAVALKPQEVKIMELLMKNKGQVVTRTMLLEYVWGITFDPKSNLVDTQICRLRAKLEAIGVGGYVETVRGQGYRFRVDREMSTHAT